MPMSVKTCNELDLEIKRREGKKKKISIAQVKEVRRIIADLCVEDMEWMLVLVNNGMRRVKPGTIPKPRPRLVVTYEDDVMDARPEGS